MDSIKTHIIRYLEEQGNWVLGGVIDREINYRTGAKESNVSRRCRELTEVNEKQTAPILERDLIQIEGKGPKVVRYRIIQEKVSVPSATQDDTKYTVTITHGGSARCTCEGYRFRGSCRHIKQEVERLKNQSMKPFI